jgi:hypothetical protein
VRRLWTVTQVFLRYWNRLRIRPDRLLKFRPGIVAQIQIRGIGAVAIMLGNSARRRARGRDTGLLREDRRGAL